MAWVIVPLAPFIGAVLLLAVYSVPTAAERKAKRLFFSYLTAEQRRHWKLTGSLMVDSPTGARFIIHKGIVGNIEVMRYAPAPSYEGLRVCVHLPQCPKADTWLAQYLAITTGNEHELIHHGIAISSYY